MIRIILFTIFLTFYHGFCTNLLYNVYYKDIELDSGPVRGFLADDGDYFAYLGIPYAAPTLGTHRFKVGIFEHTVAYHQTALPPRPWNKLIIANQTVICPQRGLGDENCLVLNVFTPTKLNDGPLPVLVYIHGGSFLIGSGQTRGFEPLIKQNVITVTLNYRLGALGFLCLGTRDAPGNAGLKDQVAALKWVQNNIDKFGGDPDQVTIYGMSAGAASVEMLVLSKLSRGLFHKAIVESGSASSVWSIDSNPIATAENFLSKTDFANHTHNWYQIIHFYQNEPSEKLSLENYNFYQTLTDGTFGFVPCLERKLFGIQQFLSSPPHKIIRRNGHSRVPILFIFASLEGLFLRSSEYNKLNYKNRMNDRFEAFMPADLKFDTEEIGNTVTENVKKFYFGNKDIGENTLKEYLNYFGDHLILHGLLNSAVDHAKQGDVVYLMEFAYKGELGSKDKYFQNIDEAGHGEAVKYTILNRKIENDDDELIAKRMTKIVSNFMKFGNPSPSRSELIPILWPAVHPDSVTYLRMDKDLQVLEEPCWHRKEFWDKLYEKHRRPIKTVNPDLL